jgi:membrane-associated phospholipid phosphatase
MNNKLAQYSVFLFSTVLLVMVTACGEDKMKVSRASDYPILQISNFDADGGQWPMILLGSPTEISVSPPDATDSPSYLTEIELSKEVVGKRDYAQTCSINYWASGSVLRWNEIARELISKTKTTPPFAARVLSLLTVTQYDALVTTWYYKYKYRRPSPTSAGVESMLPVTNFPSYPSEDAVIAATSYEILKAIFPSEKHYLYQKALEDGNCRLWAGANTKSDILAGGKLGEDVAKLVLSKTIGDNNLIEENSKYYWKDDRPPTISGKYLSTMSNVATWFDSKSVWDGTTIPSPPSLTSEEFKKDIDSVRSISKKRSIVQRSTADFWSDGSVTIVRWNEIAEDLIHPMNYSELKTANILQLLNRSIHDAAIVSWQAKYKYAVPRPSMVDPTIKTTLETPRAPSYISGHSSYSSAAATVLRYFFPKSANELNDQADKAGLAGVYAGINYFFDHKAGVRCGQKIGLLAIQQELQKKKQKRVLR